jgi:hypothetical protein
MVMGQAQAVEKTRKRDSPAAFAAGVSVSVVWGPRNHLKLLFEAAAWPLLPVAVGRYSSLPSAVFASGKAAKRAAPRFNRLPDRRRS